MSLYFMGICGTAMANGALLMRESGHSVWGADTGFYPPMSEVLAASGIEMFDGYDPARLAARAPSLAVIGNAQTRGHPEVEWILRERRLPFTSLPALLHQEILRLRPNLVVAGTHGKTTTSALAAFLLQQAGVRPGYLIGGVPLDLPSGATLGAPGSPFVIEGDEYDSAFFDKRSKFIHYAPKVLCCNNLEFDHADIFRDLQDVQRTFSHAQRLVPDNGFILANGDDPNLQALPPTPWTTVWKIGRAPGHDLVIDHFEEDSHSTRFTLYWRGRRWGRVEWGLNGWHNARNAAMAALAAAAMLHPEDPTLLDLGALGSFRGVRRRQEVRAQGGGLTVVEDFGHHPTALATTLASLRLRYPGQAIVACLEPRSNTACRAIFQREFTEALRQADAALIAPVHRPQLYPESDRLDPIRMAGDLRSGGVEAEAPASCEDLEHCLRNRLDNAGPAVVVFFSNGHFSGLIARTAEWVAQRG